MIGLLITSISLLDILQHTCYALLLLLLLLLSLLCMLLPIVTLLRLLLQNLLHQFVSLQRTFGRHTHH
jgi:uncharacterized protein YhdP